MSFKFSLVGKCPEVLSHHGSLNRMLCVMLAKENCVWVGLVGPREPELRELSECCGSLEAVSLSSQPDCAQAFMQLWRMERKMRRELGFALARGVLSHQGWYSLGMAMASKCPYCLQYRQL